MSGIAIVPRHLLSRTTDRRRHAHGVVMLVTLITLVLMLLGAVALMRSFDTASLLAGNLAFRRDLTNQGERGIAAARAAFVTGALSNPAARTSDLYSANYSSSKLPSNPQGIPTLLTKDSLFTGNGGMNTANDIVDATNGLTIRYVVDRICNATGNFNNTTCAISQVPSDKGGSSGMAKPGGTTRPVYRVSVRVSGPHDTQAFLQATFAD